MSDHHILIQDVFKMEAVANRRNLALHLHLLYIIVSTLLSKDFERNNYNLVMESAANLVKFCHSVDISVSAISF
jgi:hypothetical protein